MDNYSIAHQVTAVTTVDMAVNHPHQSTDCPTGLVGAAIPPWHRCSVLYCMWRPTKYGAYGMKSSTSHPSPVLDKFCWCSNSLLQLHSIFPFSFFFGRTLCHIYLYSILYSNWSTWGRRWWNTVPTHARLTACGLWWRGGSYFFSERRSYFCSHCSKNVESSAFAD